MLLDSVNIISADIQMHLENILQMGWRELIEISYFIGCISIIDSPALLGYKLWLGSVPVLRQQVFPDFVPPPVQHWRFTHWIPLDYGGLIPLD